MFRFSAGMTGRGDDLNPEPSHIEEKRIENVDVRLAGIASASAHLPESERTAEQRTDAFIRREFPYDRFPAVPLCNR